MLEILKHGSPSVVFVREFVDPGLGIVDVGPCFLAACKLTILCESERHLGSCAEEDCSGTKGRDGKGERGEEIGFRPCEEIRTHYAAVQRLSDFSE